jgi:hypothetical protein
MKAGTELQINIPDLKEKKEKMDLLGLLQAD